MAFNSNIAAAGGAAIGAGAGQLFDGYKNPADAAMPYMNQIPGQLNQYLGPYINAGNSALPTLNNQYNNLLNNPGGMINQIGSNYQQSPGFQFALQQALQGAGHTAAAGGMAGSPQHEQQDMTLATNLGNQDYNNYITNALGLYGQGLSGEQNIYNVGAGAGINMGEDLASALGSQAQLAYEGQNADNENQGGGWGSLLSGAGKLASMFF